MDQLARTARRRLWMMGDDTWTHLFPLSINNASTGAQPPGGEPTASESSSVWWRAHPSPSFNVKDIHTVDREILAHLLPALDAMGQRYRSPNSSSSPGNDTDDQWDLLIAHFLGVDHIGHRFSAHSPLMGAKLTLMDDTVRRAVAAVDRDYAECLRERGTGRWGGDGGEREQRTRGSTTCSSSKLHAKR